MAKSKDTAKKDKKTKRKVGRPTKYSFELAQKICDRIASQEYGLHTICKEDGFPGFSTVFKWLCEKDKQEFVDMYTRARQMQAELLKDNMIAISDDSRQDTEIRFTPSGEAYEVENKEWTNRVRLRLDTRKFIASKLHPRVYGQKVDLTTDGQPLPAQQASVIVVTHTEEQKKIAENIS